MANYLLYFSCGVFVTIYAPLLCECASVLNKENSSTTQSALDIIKEDISQIGSGIENFTFHILKNLIEDDNNETTTNEEETKRNNNNNTQIQQHIRRKRDVKSDADDICNKVQFGHVQDLKIEVKKLQELVALLKDQQKIINILKNETETAQQKDIDQINADNGELEIIKSNLDEAAKNLNTTRYLIEVQKRRSDDLEFELETQKHEIMRLKKILNKLINNMNTNGTILNDNNNNMLRSEEPDDLTPQNPQERASGNFPELEKFITDMASDDSVQSDDDLKKKVRELETDLARRKIEDGLMKRLKAGFLKKLQDNNTQSSQSKSKDLLEQILRALDKDKIEEKSGDDNIDNLLDLQDAINRLRPKEEPANNVDPLQFQIMLNKLLNNNNNNNNNINNRRPVFNSNSKLTLTPQQMDIIRKNLLQPQSLSNTPQFLCSLDDRSAVNVKPQVNYAPQIPVNYAPPAPIPVNYAPQPQPNYQFFPGPPALSNQANTYAANNEKSGYYPADNKYQEDLKTQIDGLQAAIDGLNRPEYVTKPEDQAMISDLERQISDLRGIVNSLNTNSNTYEASGSANNINNNNNSYRRRKKRSTDDNKIDDNNEIIDGFATLFKKMLDDDKTDVIAEKPSSSDDHISGIQTRINQLRNELDSNTNPNARSASGYYYPPSPSELYPTSPGIVNYGYGSVPKKRTSSLFDVEKKSIKTDIFTAIVAKILDKLIAAIPVVIQKLFNFNLGELSKYDYEDYDLSVIFKNLGVLGFIPAVLVRILKGFSAFLRILKKNNFFNKFLLPAVILAVVAGSVLFLMWWLQSDQYGYYDNDKYGNSYGTDAYNNYNGNYNSNGGYSPPKSGSSSSSSSNNNNYPAYSRSYNIY